MARIESGTAVLQLKAEDMDALFHRVNTVFEEDVRKKNLQYHDCFRCKIIIMFV